jgi:DNA-directed RNA polymerase specialized sigma24 family protein
MRRILVEAARRKGRVRHAGNLGRQELREEEIACLTRPDTLLALDEALNRLAVSHTQAAELVKLRYFVGFTNLEAAEILGISPRKADQLWAYSRAWLLEELGDE